MRKLPTRPPRFVAVDNRAVDDQRLSVLDIGLLTMALRLPDGADFTIAALAQTRKPGREALTKAMRNLVAYGYIVKLKIQDAADGTWRTEFSVAGLPHRQEDIHHLLAQVTGTRAVRIEPAWLDPRNHHTPAPTSPEPIPPEAAATDSPAAQSALRPVTTGLLTRVPPVTTPKTCAGPSDGFPAVGDPAVGDPAVGEPAAGQPTAGDPSAKELRLNKQDGKNSSLSSPPTTPQRPTVPASKRETTTPSGQTPPPHPPPATPSPLGPTGDDPGNAGTSAPAPARSAPGVPQAAAPAPHGHTPGTADPGAPAPAGPAPAGPRAVAAARIADAWTTARHHHGHPVPALAPGRIAHTAEALLATGIQEQHLTQAATAMARKPTWYDLKRHLEHWTPPTTPQPATRPTQAAYCGQCDHGWTTDPDGRARKCPCRTQQHP
ncbi:hypothetical protein ACIF70_42640 [Actinacidiphila glaucinigra]|uniref:hypothetical protein n=1 Tax=Actinacidiphila glaucinigra TaxID=235986 RepID=UPI0037CB7C2E